MSETYVFDAEPVIAYCYDEPGADRVESLLTAIYDGDATGLLSEVTATEITYKIAWLEADDRPTDADLDIGRTQIKDIVDGGCRLESTTDSWEVAARVKASGGIALGDAFAVALAEATDALLVAGADDDFDELPFPVRIERIRERSA
ncbi:PIN domain-containing protein [Halococcus qingdaonensis]|uniref:PIN domain-containing protein n=1 Tax=Halococcus qingdaonensis TaxID=224402 RepID=UPI002116AD07|nr:PIN domain-containing protein [Halococcus qingdaonensis]